MLVLEHRAGEEVWITAPDGTHLRVCVVETHTGKIKLGFDAPRDYLIGRKEVALGAARQPRTSGRRA